jgi:hypothetical protein
MQYKREGKPSRQDAVPPLPQHPPSLTALRNDSPPQFAEPISEEREPRQVTWNSVVLVVSRDYFTKPLTDQCDWVMTAIAQLQLNFLKFGHHPLLCRFAPDREGAVLTLPTIVREAQEGERLWFPSPRRLRA